MTKYFSLEKKFLAYLEQQIHSDTAKQLQKVTIHPKRSKAQVEEVSESEEEALAPKSKKQPKKLKKKSSSADEE